MATGPKQVLDRMHQINGTVGEVTDGTTTVSLNTTRYWPSSSQGRQPLIVPMWLGILSYRQQPGSRRTQAVHQFANFVFVEEVTAGIPTQSAQKELELLVPALEQVYGAAESLELNLVPLAGVVQFLATGVESFLQREILATLQFNYQGILWKAK